LSLKKEKTKDESLVIDKLEQTGEEDGEDPEA